MLPGNSPHTLTSLDRCNNGSIPLGVDGPSGGAGGQPSLDLFPALILAFLTRGRQISPGDRVGPEPDGVEELEVTLALLNMLQLDGIGSLGPGLPGLVAGFIGRGGRLDRFRQGHRRQAGQLEQVARPAPCPSQGITQRIGQTARAIVPQDQIALGAADLTGAAVGREVSIPPALGV